jgi:hypothetical protein
MPQNKYHCTSTATALAPLASTDKCSSSTNEPNTSSKNNKQPRHTTSSFFFRDFQHVCIVIINITTASYRHPYRTRNSSSQRNTPPLRFDWHQLLHQPLQHTDIEKWEWQQNQNTKPRIQQHNKTNEIHPPLFFLVSDFSFTFFHHLKQPNNMPQNKYH